MESITEDFVLKFYFLEGNLVGERKRNFSLLLSQLASLSDPHLVQHFITNLKPRNYLESLFRIDALIYFKRTAELLEVLKENNEVFNSKIFKQHWFFEEAFKNVDVEMLVNDFIQHLSFANRKKCLKKMFLILEPEQTDRLFSLIYTRYGLFLAKKFLHFCTEEKIMDVLKEEEISLQANQVKHLFNRNEKLFICYLNYYLNTFTGTYGDFNVLEHIGLRNIDLLLTLISEEKVSSFKLGKRTSKKAFQIVQNNIPQNFEKYTRQLNNNVMFRNLGKDFNDIYYNRLPQHYSDLSAYNEFEILRHLPKSKRWNVFSELFYKKYPDNSILELSFDDLLNNCPDRDIIKKRAEASYKETEISEYLKYLDTPISIHLIKEKINVTSDIYVRRKLVELLIESCSENKDYKTFESVLKYICYRHRNEELSVRHNILSTIRQFLDLEKFNDTHWNYINEQIKIIRIQKDFSLYQYKVFSVHYLAFLFKNKKDFKEALKEYIDDVLDGNNFELLDLKDQHIEQQILIEIFKYTDQGYIKNSCSVNHFVDIVITILSFNNKNPELNINIEDFKALSQYIHFVCIKTCFIYSDIRLIHNIIMYKNKHPTSFPNLDNDRIFKIFSYIYSDDKNYSIEECLKTYILKKDRNDLENKIMVAYFTEFIKKHPNSFIINWFLENEPQSISPYFKNILLADEITSINLKICKFYSHFDFDKQLLVVFKSKLENKKPDGKDTYLEKYKILLTTDEFIDVIIPFLPEKEKLDLQDQNMTDIFHVQCNIAKMLHRVIEPHKMLPIIIKFCLGDYLQSTIPALYSTFYRSPEKLLPSYIDIISKRAVSARKHALFLTCEVLDQNHAINILTMTQHCNVSSQKHLFLATLKYFRKNPCEILLNLVISNMSTIDKNDKETLESLINYYETIPKKYKIPYMEKCWSFYEELEQKEVKTEQYLTKLLSAIMGNEYIMKNLSTLFVTNILNKYLGSNKLYNSIDFGINVLIYREIDHALNFDLIFSIISAMNKSQIKSFFVSFTSRNLSNQFVNLLNKYWNKYFTKIDTFWEHIYLNLWILNLSSTTQDIFARNATIYLNEILTEFSCYVFPIFENVFREFLDNQEKIYRYQLFEKILNYQKTSTVCILVLNVMTPVDLRSTHIFPIFLNILDIIKTVEHPGVTIYYKKYLSDHGLKE